MSPFNAVISIQTSGESTTEPITLAEAKEWLYITDNSHDVLLPTLIKVARMQLEKAANISIITRTVTTVLRNDCGGISLPMQPITGAVTATDRNGDSLTLTLLGENYKFIETTFEYAKLVYTAGFSTVPEDIKQAVKQQVAHLFENRGDTKVSYQSYLFISQYLVP